jgi:fucose 4-O-acetylase-like acetyltransferase
MQTLPSTKPAGPGAAASVRIKAARVLCILALVYVHVPPWHPQNGGGTPFDLIFVTLQEAFARTSVPLLSVVSGYLLVTTDRARGYSDMIGRKLRSLIVPLMLWNVIAAALNLAVGDLPATGILGWLDRLVALRTTPLITPLYFLRDVFLCMLLSPLLVLAVRRAAAPALIVLTGLALTGLLDRIWITSLILVFFTAGLAIGIGRFPVRRFPPTPVVLLFFLPVAAISVDWALHGADGGLIWAVEPSWVGAAMRCLSLAQRAAGALMFWMLTDLAVRSRLKPGLFAVEPFIFFFFCAHALVLNASWRALTPLGLTYGDPAYQVYFLSAPFTTLAICMAGALILLRIWPGLLKALCGGRLPRWRWGEVA